MNNRKNVKNVINLKKYDFNSKKDLNLKSNNELSNFLTNTQCKNYLNRKKSCLQIQTDNINLINKNIFTPSKLKRNKTTNFFYYNNKKDNSQKKLLSKEDKIKMNSIIQKFKKYKFTTKDLFEKDKNMLLNSIKKKNIFNFLFDKEEKEKTNKNKNNLKQLKKASSLLISSSMVNKFNKKTFSILDSTFSKSIKFSKNIFSFRNQIINSYKDRDKYYESAEYSKNKYRDALDILDETEDKKIENLLKREKQFYKLKNKKMGLYGIVLDKEEEENKEYYKRFKISLKKNKNIKNKPLNSQNIEFYYKFNSSNKDLKDTKNELNINNKNNIKINDKSLEDINKSKNKKIFFSENDKSIEDINKSKNRKICFSENNKKKNRKNILINIKSGRNKLNKFKIKKNIKERKLSKLMKKFWFLKKKKILENSKRLVNSISEMNLFTYIPKGYTDYKNSTLNINSKDLIRIIKLTRLNKYLYNLENDDDLLDKNSKKLRELMRESEKQYYLCNKKDFELSYLRKTLKPQTISKFSRFKTSFFGFPC